MKINDTQAAMLTIQLATLGQTDLSDNDLEVLITMEHLLSEALNNVREAMTAIGVTFYRAKDDAKT